MVRRSIAVAVATLTLLGAASLPVGSAVLVKATKNLSGDDVFKPRRVQVARGRGWSGVRWTGRIP
ncbi:MAG: hypothetical protein WD096_08120 [Actinomycetota bacterium]